MSSKPSRAAATLPLLLLSLASARLPNVMAADDATARIRASPQLVENALRETGAQRELPDPNWSTYLSDVAEALLHWTLTPLDRFAPASRPWIQVLAWLLLAVVVGVLVVWLARWLLDALRSSQAHRQGTDAALEPRPVTRAPGPGAWRDEIERRLAEGRIGAALEAVWWWMASSIMTREVDASWTSRELLVAAQRPDLSVEAATLDCMAYGRILPSRADLTALVRRLDARLR